MTKKNVSITRHGNCLQVKAGNYRESFETRLLVDDVIVDKVKWIFITGGVSISEETIRELLRQNGVIAW